MVLEGPGFVPKLEPWSSQWSVIFHVNLNCNYKPKLGYLHSLAGIDPRDPGSPELRMVSWNLNA